MKSGRRITRLHLKHWTVHGNTVNTVDLLGGPYPPHRPRHSKFFSAHRPACSVCLHCRDTMKSLRQTYAHFQAAPLGSRPGKRVGVCVCLAVAVGVIISPRADCETRFILPLFVFVLFLWPCPWYMDVPGPGIEPAP